MKQVQEKLFSVARDKFDGDYGDCLMEQYKLYVSSVNHNSQRRQKTNDFFLALNTGLIISLSFINASLENSRFLMIASSLLGIVICYFWYLMIKAYRLKSRGKFRVIHEIEKRLPLAMYHTEWAILKKGKNPEFFTPFTVIELKIPGFFAFFYFMVMIWGFGIRYWGKFFGF